MERAELVYYAKKSFALFPGVLKPVCAPVFSAHYHRRRECRSLARAALDAAIGRAFLAWIPGRARKVAAKFGKDEAWRRRAESIAVERFADPNDLALFGIEQADELDGYIRRFEDAGFNKVVNPMGWSRRCVLVDKAAFYRRCAESGLPHPEVHAVVADSKPMRFDLPAPCPLIAKPTHGEGGRGVTAIPERLARESDADVFARELVALTGSAGPTWVVQRRVANHPALAEYGLGALVTARLTTMRDEAGGHELVNAVLRLPTNPQAIIDNMKAGGLILPLDLETGRSGAGCQGYAGGYTDIHPVTGARLNALVLPDWKEAVALACRAHAEAFGEYALIGWDVAFTPEGPMLVEGNAKPGVLMPQRSWRKGLAGQRYGELLAYNLARMEGAAA